MNFLALPPEIRLQIYILLLDPNKYTSGYKHIRRLTKRAYNDTHSNTDPRHIPNVTLPRIYVTRYTPPILLLNHQITTEALPVLYNTELTLRGTPETYFVLRQMDIAEFICETLLQRMRYVVLRLASPEKFFVLSLLDIWGVRNELRRLVVYIPVMPAYEEAGGSGSKFDFRSRRHWDIVESRLRTFANAASIPLETRSVKKPLRDKK